MLIFLSILLWVATLVVCLLCGFGAAIYWSTDHRVDPNARMNALVFAGAFALLLIHFVAFGCNLNL
jgi:hypothetical protein